MPTLLQLKQDLTHLYQQKYGPVQISFEHFSPEGDDAASLIATISDQKGFIPRYYGKVAYRGDRLYLRARSI